MTAKYGDQTKELHLYVVAGNRPSLLGRNWVTHLRLNLAMIAKIVTGSLTPTLESITAKHANVFKEELGTITPIKAELQLRVDTRPRFCKLRSILHATKQAIENELDCLKSSGILKLVQHSAWAAPIVAVPKKEERSEFAAITKSQ